MLVSGCVAPLPAIDDGVVLEVPTYDGSGQIAHPTVIDFLAEYNLESWGGYRYWMSASPYPNARDAFENPCLWGSRDGITWEIPRGLSEPLIPAPVNYRRHSVYNSDPTIVYNPSTDTIELYYRESQGRGDDDAIVFHRLDIMAHAAAQSAGITGRDTDWGLQVADMPLEMPPFSRAQTLLSPSVVIDGDGNHFMYAVGTAPTGSLAVLVLEGGQLGLSYGDPVACTPVDGSRIEAPEGMPPVTPWHLTAKGDAVSGDITLLINGQSREGRKRIRNLYWAHTRFDASTQLAYPQTAPFLQAQDGWQPYRSAFVLPSEKQGTPLRLWLNIYTQRSPQTWGIVYQEQ